MTELTADLVEPALRSFLQAAGSQLTDWHLRSVHRRGEASASMLVEGAVTEATGRQRDLLYVLHVARHDVPAGASLVEVDGRALHVWQFPDDPYLPGLRAAVSRRRGRQRLDRLGLAGGAVGRPTIHTRSYRPTRRAVVELSPPDEPATVLYLKVLGARTSEGVRARTTELVAVHVHLGRHLPVPRVLEHDATLGTLALEPLAGETLRRLLRRGDTLPPVAEVADLVARIAATPPPPGNADPGRYADITRHVRLLSEVVPDRADDLDRVARAVSSLAGPTGTVHGDLHDGQVMVVDDEVRGLLDVDGAGTGLLAHDAGRLVANIEVAGLTAPEQSSRATRYATGLASELTALVPPPHLARAAAAAWIGLATGPHRVRGPAWRDATRARIDRALAWVRRI